MSHSHSTTGGCPTAEFLNPFFFFKSFPPLQPIFTNLNIIFSLSKANSLFSSPNALEQDFSLSLSHTHPVVDKHMGYECWSETFVLQMLEWNICAMNVGEKGMGYKCWRETDGLWMLQINRWTMQCQRETDGLFYVGKKAVKNWSVFEKIKKEHIYFITNEILQTIFQLYL